MNSQSAIRIAAVSTEKTSAAITSVCPSTARDTRLTYDNAPASAANVTKCSMEKYDTMSRRTVSTDAAATPVNKTEPSIAGV
jgi:hypothetical protein